MLLFLRLWLLLSLFLSVDLSTWRGVVPNEPNLFPFSSKSCCAGVCYSPRFYFQLGQTCLSLPFFFWLLIIVACFFFLPMFPCFSFTQVHIAHLLLFGVHFSILLSVRQISACFFSSSIAWAKQRGSHVVGGERSVLFPTFSMFSFQRSTASSSSTSAVISCWYPSLPRSHAVDGATFYF